MRHVGVAGVPSISDVYRNREHSATPNPAQFNDISLLRCDTTCTAADILFDIEDDDSSDDIVSEEAIECVSPLI